MSGETKSHNVCQVRVENCNPGNWSGGKEGSFGNKEEFIGNCLKLGNQVKGVVFSCLSLLVCLFFGVYFCVPCVWWFVEPMTKLDGKIVMWTHDFYGMNLVSELLFYFLYVSIRMNWFDV